MFILLGFEGMYGNIKKEVFIKNMFYVEFFIIKLIWKNRGLFKGNI